MRIKQIAQGIAKKVEAEHNEGIGQAGRKGEPWVTTMPGGFSASEHVEDIVSAAQAGPLPDAIHDRFAMILSE